MARAAELLMTGRLLGARESAWSSVS